MTTQPRRWVLIAVFAMLMTGVVAAQPVSPGETLLFETNHLAGVSTPATLIYAFIKTSDVEPGFSDTVQLDLAATEGRPKASLRFLTGAHEHAIPAVDDPHGNPVLLGFLERDIAEMKRRTGGSANYFRKRIRMALAEAARLSAQSISYNGKQVQAQVVRIQPYLDDPMRPKLEKYVAKTYTFVVSDQVPGGVYRLSTSLGSAGASPVIDETLTLVKVAHPKR